MAGQREQKLPVGPGFSAPASDPSTRVQSQVIQHATPQDRASTQDGLAGVLDGFFGKTTSLIERAGDIQQREDLTLIDRENKGLTIEAKRAADAGEAPNPESMKRYDYFTAFQATTSTNMADKAALDYAADVAKAPTDGTFDAAAHRDSFLKAEFGAGTGEKVYDEKFLSTFKRNTDGLVATHQKAVIDTTKRNAIDAFSQNVTGTVQSTNGIDTDAISDLQAQAIALSDGDQGKGKKLFTLTLSSAITNPVNSHGVLVALDKSGWAEQNPDSYLDLTKAAAGRVASITSAQASEAYTGLGNRVAAAIADPNTTGAGLLALSSEIQDTFSKRGGSAQAAELMQKLIREFPKLMKAKADTNLIVAAHDGNAPIERVAANMAMKVPEIVNKQLDDALIVFAGRDNKYPALAATAQGNFMDPLASDAAAADFSRLVTDSRVLGASAGLLSPNYKSYLSRGLTDGMKPDVQARATTMFKDMERVVGKDFIGRYMDPAAEGQYKAAREFAGTDTRGYYERLQANPAEKELFVDGHIAWAKATGSTKKDSEVEADVTTALRKGFLEASDRNGWFSGYSAAFPNPDTQKQIQLEVARNLQRQMGTNGSANMDEAVKVALDVYKDRVVMLPGRNKTMQVVMDPMQGKGRDLTNPVSVIDGQAVYAPAKVKNALGEVEDTTDTFRKDLQVGVDTLGGKLDDVKKLSLDLSDHSAQGLFKVVNTTTGNNVFFSPGEPINVRKAADAQATVMDRAMQAIGGFGTPGVPMTLPDNTETLTIPADRAEAKAFLTARLPKGFHLMESEYGGKTAYVLAYGFRLETGRTEANAILAKRETEVVGLREARRAAATARSERNATGLRKPGEL